MATVVLFVGLVIFLAHLFAALFELGRITGALFSNYPSRASDEKSSES